MPQHKSAEKRVRQSARRHARNKADISKMKSVIKKVRSSKEKEKAAAALKIAVKTLDQLSAKGIIHKNKAANQKSSLTKYVNALK
ncbi:MAG: 30S ribosomal protein S20 [Ignavibacteriales bacterium]|jgi:small subunit ribosomal protein S20|nr:30S ribosomal protein S20 [Ignavibacteriales bacterium]